MLKNNFKHNKNKYLLYFLSFSVFSLLLFFCKNYKKYTILEGSVFGTYFKIIHPKDQTVSLYQIDSIFELINQSINTYRPDSKISAFNRGENIAMDSIFLEVFQSAQKIHQETDHYFNPAIEPLLSAYKKRTLTAEEIQNYLPQIQFQDFQILPGNRLQGDGMHQLNFNAIGKGYGVQKVADFLVHQGIENILVEIGGEIVTKGFKDGKAWQIAIENPSLEKNNTAFASLGLSNRAIATSGSYRQFISQKQQKLSHIIDPNTGTAYISSLISVTVVHPDCTIADAYATALMAMGKEKALVFAKERKDLPIFLIFQTEDQKTESAVFNFAENNLKIEYP